MRLSRKLRVHLRALQKWRPNKSRRSRCCEKLKSFLIKSTYGYFAGPLLPCPHPASKDSAVHGFGHLANFPYDLPEDVTPLTECGRSRF